MRDLSGSGQYLTLASSLGITVPDDPLWAFIWAEFDSTVTAQVLLSLGLSGAGSERRYVIVQSNTVQAITNPAAGPVAASTPFSTTGVKVGVLAEWPSMSLRAITVNNGTRATESTSRSMSNVPNQIRIGATHTASAPFNGRLGPIGIWRGTPTADDKQALWAQIHPELVRPTDQLDVIELTGRMSPERSLKGNAYTLTGSPGYADAPRLFRRRRRSMIFVPGSGVQTLDLPTIAITATLAAPTLAAGAVTLTLPAIASTASVLAPSVSPGAVSLGLPAIASAAALTAPALAVGAVSISLQTIASTASLAAPTLAPGAATVALPAIASASTMAAPTVAPGAVGVALPAIASVSSLAAPTVTPGVAAVVLPVIPSTATLHALTLVGTGAIALPTIASTATLTAPTLTAEAVTVTLPSIASAAATHAPVLTAGTAALALPTITASPTLHVPALAPGLITVTLPWLTSTAVLFSPTIIDGDIPLYDAIRVGGVRSSQAGAAGVRTGQAGASGVRTSGSGAAGVRTAYD